MTDDLQVAMLLKSFGDKKESQFGPFIVSLQTRAGMLKGDTVTSILIQEYEEQLMREGKNKDDDKGGYSVHDQWSCTGCML